MESMVMWFFIALLQGEGMIGINASSEFECKEEYDKAVQSPNVLAASKCVSVELKKVTAPSSRT